MAEEPKKTWFNYTALTGAGPEIADDGSRVLCSIPIQRPGQKPLELAIIGDKTRLDIVRIATPETDGDLSEEEQHKIGNITEHAISILRLLYGPDIGRLQFAGGNYLSLGQFAKDDGSPQLKVNVQEFGPLPSYDGQTIKNAISQTGPLRVHMSLLAEAFSPRTPLAFRYLCFYKVLELELRKNGRWIGLDGFLEPYTKEFRDLKISEAKLTSFLHNYRDKCAHIKTGRNDELGLTGLGSRDGAKVSSFLPLLHKIVADLVNSRYSDRIKIGPPPAPPRSLNESEVPPEFRHPGNSTSTRSP